MIFLIAALVIHGLLYTYAGALFLKSASNYDLDDKGEYRRGEYLVGLIFIVTAAVSFGSALHFYTEAL